MNLLPLTRVTTKTLLQDAAPLAAVLVAFFEFILFWCLACGIAVFAHELLTFPTRRRKTTPGEGHP